MQLQSDARRPGLVAGLVVSALCCDNALAKGWLARDWIGMVFRNSMTPLVVAFAMLASVGCAHAADAGLQALVAAYPDFLASQDGGFLLWKDGTRQPVSDGRDDKSFDEKLARPSILDQMSLPYPAGPLSAPPALQNDPGRFRNIGFFDKIYGDCDRGETQKRLVKIAWLPKSQGGSVVVTSVNGVADRLTAVSRALDELPARLKIFAYPSAGAFNCRVVKDTGNRSGHAWGIAIDLNTKYADYWLWARGGAYKNQMPAEIVEIFEQQGFIWGGKWGHFDTMHFEFRPELTPEK